MPRLYEMTRPAVGTLITILGLASIVFAQGEPLETARQQYARGQYENAEQTLGQIIDSAQGAPSTAAARSVLASALDLRGRVRFDLDKTADAQADFERLLKAFPAHQLSPDARTKHAELFQSIRTKIVGTVYVQVSPQDATLAIDGERVASGQIALAAGPHRITVTREAYTTEERNIVVTADASETVNIELERAFALLRLMVAPEGAEIMVNGASRGTAQELPPVELAGNDSVGFRMFEVSDLIRGNYEVIVRKPCFVAWAGTVTIDRMTDLRIAPVRLQPAVATLEVKSPAAGIPVFVDGVQKGQTPLTINDLCEGPHDVEIRSPEGMYMERVIATAGAALSVAGEPKPSIAVVSVAGIPPGVRVGADLRQQVSDQLRAGNVRLYVPVEDSWSKLRSDEKLSESWLAFDTEQRPLFDASGFTPAARLELSRSVTAGLRTQAVAAITVIEGRTTDLALSILAAGSTRPDVLHYTSDSPRSSADVVEQLNARFELFRPSLGMLLIDVADVTGAIVARVDAGGPAAVAGIQTGEVISSIGGQPVSSASVVTRALAANGRAVVEVKNRAGQARTVELAARRQPRAVSVEDRTFPFNLLLLDLRSRLSGLEDLDAMVARLNIGIALMSLGNWRDARTQLEGVSLPRGAGVSAGTVQYLLGLCDEKLNRFADAQNAWQAAAKETTALLTEDGPLISELASEKLKIFAR